MDPEKPKPKYWIIRASSSQELEDAINEWDKKGYEPVGGPTGFVYPFWNNVLGRDDTALEFNQLMRRVDIRWTEEELKQEAEHQDRICTLRDDEKNHKTKA